MKSWRGAPASRAIQASATQPSPGKAVDETCLIVTCTAAPVESELQCSSFRRVPQYATDPACQALTFSLHPALGAEMQNDRIFAELPAVLRASVAFEACNHILESSNMFGQLPREVGACCRPCSAEHMQADRAAAHWAQAHRITNI